MAVQFGTAPSIPLRDLTNALSRVEAKWRELGVQFGFTENELDAIQAENPVGSVRQWLSSMLNAKLNNFAGFSWNDVISALEALGQSEVAAEVRHQNNVAGPNMAVTEMVKIKESELKSEFAVLVEQACTCIEANRVEPHVFRSYARTIFAPALHIIGDDIREMFDLITAHCHWGYLHYRSLLEMVKKFDYDRQLHETLHQYKESVANFTFATRITDWIVAKNLRPTQSNNPPPPLEPSQYIELTVKVDINITDRMMTYVVGLWEEVAEQLLRLPNLDAVLHGIREECLLITWHLPNSEKLKALIRDRASQGTSFFEGHMIKYCLLDNEQIYMAKDCPVTKPQDDSVSSRGRQSSLPDTRESERVHATGGAGAERTPLLPKRSLYKSAVSPGSINEGQEEPSRCHRCRNCCRHCCCCVIL